MPVLTGKIVDSVEASERFLWDWRKTIGELIVENSYEVEDSILAVYGMKGRYSESHESSRAYLADGMEVKRHAAVPMAAQWVIDILKIDGHPLIQADIRESASVAHIYGQNRLIGDAQKNINERITFTATPFYAPDASLSLSGLIGPVRLVKEY